MLGVPSPTIPLPPGLELAGRYRLGAPVRGGAGNSYMAHDMVQDAPVVVKLLGAMPFDVDLERVRRAAEPLRLADMACVPRSIEICDARLQDRHCVFLVQEFIDGESLEERLLRTGPLPPAEVRVLARRLLELLRAFAAAEPPLIHGDIHPRNLLIGPDNGEPFLVDWGPVKAAARDWSSDSYGPEGWTQAVDRAFAAPEVPMGSANARSDLYGVGACLAYALTGLAPDALRAKDRRGRLGRTLEDLHLPRSLSAVLEPMLESTLERRLESPQAALDLLLDPLAGRRGSTTVRHAGEPVDWHMEPHPRLGALWSGAGVVAACLLAMPLAAAALAIAAPVGFGMAAWIVALRLGLGLALGVCSVLVLVAGVRALSPMGRLRLQGMGRALRFQRRRQWVEIPWLQLGRVRRLGPLLRIDGAWAIPPDILPRRRVLWIAPVYDDVLDRLSARIGAHRARSRALVSGVLRHGARRWPGSRRPSLGLALPVGLVLLGAVLLTTRWGSDEPTPDGGVLRAPSLESTAGPEGEGEGEGEGGGSSGAPAFGARLALAAAQRPVTTPEQARADAVAAAKDVAELASTDFERALAASQGRSVEAAAPPAVPSPDSVRSCPGALEPRLLASSELLSIACWDQHGTMVWVPSTEGQPGFLVDWTEVSVADYARCVADDACETAGRHTGCYGTEAARRDYPVNCVVRAQAQAWCAWSGRRLCSLDEHARAARGAEGAVYPWGDAPPACDRVIMDARGQQGPAGGTGCGRGSPWPVGSKPAGVSPVGALDLSGNVAEWVSGVPGGLAGGGQGGVAGGGFMDRASEELQAGSLRPLPEDLPVPDVGFRCCLDGD